MKNVRWAIVGTGDVSTAIALDFHRAADAELVAVCSRSETRAASFAADIGASRGYGDLSQLWDDRTIDAVYIATPHGTHRAIARAALAAGKHVMVEKPLALTRAEAADILDLSSSVGLLAMEAMWMKFSPMMEGLRQTVREGAIGEVRSIRASFGVPFPRGVGSRWSAALGGSTLLDQGIYPVTLAHILLGDPAAVNARAEFEGGVDVSVHATLEYAGGKYAQVAASCVEYADMSATVNGTAGWITIDAPFWAGSGFTVHRPSSGLTGGERREFTIEGNGFTPMIEAACRAILSGSLLVDEHTPLDILAVYRQLDDLRRSVPSWGMTGEAGLFPLGPPNDSE